MRETASHFSGRGYRGHEKSLQMEHRGEEGSEALVPLSIMASRPPAVADEVRIGAAKHAAVGLSEVEKAPLRLVKSRLQRHCLKSYTSIRNELVCAYKCCCKRSK